MLCNLEYKMMKTKEIKEISFRIGSKIIRNEDFILIGRNSEGIEIDLIPNNPIEILNFSLDIDMEFDKTKKVFVNGYQSWTDSKEVGIRHKDKSFSPILNGIIEKFKFKQYGDYNFYQSKNVSGLFHSLNYSYIKGEAFYFIGSLNDNKAFTFIEFDTNEDVIRIKRDLEGRIISEKFELLNLFIKEGEEKAILSEYFTLLGLEKKEEKIARGWTSWYNYYEDITEEIIIKNLYNFKARELKLDYFQIDDGYQKAVGDWLEINEKFPKGMKYQADEIKRAGYKAGIWLAPFSAEKKSKLVEEHPEWILRDKKGAFVYGGSNWSSFYALDIYNADFRKYLKKVFDTYIKDWGYDLFKLDFLYSACLLPREDKTRAEVMEDAMNLLRELIGDKEILACGVPIYSAFGKCDYCRIGCDIGLDWDDKFYMRYFHRERISTKNAVNNSIYRQHMDAYAFYNDPDVFLLRDSNIKLSQNQKESLFWINHLFGTVLFTSDDISLYGEKEWELYRKSFEIESRKILEVFEDRDFYKITALLNGERVIFLINLRKKVHDFEGNRVEAFGTKYFRVEE